MKTIVKILIISSISLPAFCLDYNQKVPGKNYTLREYLYQRSLIKTLKDQNKKINNEDELQGFGFEFHSNLIIEEEEQETPSLNPKISSPIKVKVKKYKAFVRNCGKIDLPDNSIEKSKLKSGVRIVIRFTESRSCKVSDWKLF